MQPKPFTDILVAQNYLQLWEEKLGGLLQKQSEYIYNMFLVSWEGNFLTS